MDTPRENTYRAFISYSHADAKIATWLHRALEFYRVPRKLVGAATAVGPVPRRLTPIFKDRDELAASGDLSVGLKEALAAAQFLIVVASPASARSRWVNEEVRMFKALHGEACVLVVIAAGEPNASEVPERAAEECFAPALRFHVDTTGTIGTTPAETIAADLRALGDGRKLAKLKIVAGLTGLKLDVLARREAQRRQRRITGFAVAASGLALIMSGLTAVAIRARHEAEQQRAEADGLVEFMLTDLRKKLEPVGRLDVLDVVGRRALKYYGDQDLTKLDADALGRRARALHLVGEVRNTRGDSEGALSAFQEALATTGELLARDPHNGQRLFDHAQSVFWVGYVAYQRGLLAEAEAQFRAYQNYADELVRIDPNNADWQMEVSYANSNLGTLLLAGGRYAEAATAFAAALRIVEAAARRKPGDAAAAIEVGQDISWLAITQDRLNHTAAAIALLRRELAIYHGVLAADPKNMTARTNAVTALESLANLELSNGDIHGSIGHFMLGDRLIRQIIAQDPNNNNLQEIAFNALYGLANDAFYARDFKASRVKLAAADRLLALLRQRDPRNVHWTVDLPSFLDGLRGSLAKASGDCAAAVPMFNTAAINLRRRVKDAEADKIWLGWAEQRAGDCAAQLGQRPAAVAAWQAALADMTEGATASRSTQMAIRYNLLKRLGRIAEARQIRIALDQRGYRHPDYLQEKLAGP